MPCLEVPQDHGLTVAPTFAEGEPDVDAEHALVKEPIVGTETVLLDKGEPGARQAQPLKAPTEMAQAEWEAHSLTHRPFLFRLPFLCHGS